MNSKVDVLEILGSILDDKQGTLKLSKAQNYEDLYKLYKYYEGKLNIDDFKEEFDKFVCSRINRAKLSEDNLQAVSGGKGSKVAAALMAGLATVSSTGIGVSAGHFVSSSITPKQVMEKSKNFVKSHPWITAGVGIGVPGSVLTLGALTVYLLADSKKEPDPPSEPGPGSGGDGPKSGERRPGSKKDVKNKNFWSSRNNDDKDLTYTEGNHYRACNNDYDISSFTLSADSTTEYIIKYFGNHAEAAKRLSFENLNIVEFKAQGDVQNEKLAIVNAANANLGGGNGCCGVVYGADQFAEEEASKWKHETGLSRLNTGDAMIQRATGLRGNGISYIIQALGPNLRDKSSPADENIKKQLVNAYVNSIKLAAAHRCTAVAFPSISTGIFKYPENEASLLAVQAVIQALEQTDARDLKVCLSTYGMSSNGSSVLVKFAKAHKQFMENQLRNAPEGSNQGVVTEGKSEEEESSDLGSEDHDNKSTSTDTQLASTDLSPASSPELLAEEPHEEAEQKRNAPVQPEPTISPETKPVVETQMAAEPAAAEPHQEDQQNSGAAAPAAEIQAPVVNTAPPEAAQPVVQNGNPTAVKPTAAPAAPRSVPARSATVTAVSSPTKALNTKGCSRERSNSQSHTAASETSTPRTNPEMTNVSNGSEASIFSREGLGELADSLRRGFNKFRDSMGRKSDSKKPSKTLSSSHEHDKKRK